MFKVDNRGGLEALAGRKPQPKPEPAPAATSTAALDKAQAALADAADKMVLAANAMAQAAATRAEPKRLKATIERNTEGRITGAIIDVL